MAKSTSINLRKRYLSVTSASAAEENLRQHHHLQSRSDIYSAHLRLKYNFHRDTRVHFVDNAGVLTLILKLAEAAHQAAEPLKDHGSLVT
jgi:hypothetical protein